MPRTVILVMLPRRLGARHRMGGPRLLLRRAGSVAGGHVGHAPEQRHAGSHRLHVLRRFLDGFRALQAVRAHRHCEWGRRMGDAERGMERWEAGRGRGRGSGRGSGRERGRGRAGFSSACASVHVSCLLLQSSVERRTVLSVKLCLVVGSRRYSLSRCQVLVTPESAA